MSLFVAYVCYFRCFATGTLLPNWFFFGSHRYGCIQAVMKELFSYVLYLLTYLLTYSMGKSPPCKAKQFATSQKLSAFYGTRIHKCPPPVFILSQLNLVHTPTYHFLEIHLNIILPSTPGSPQRSPSLRLPYQNPVHDPPPYALHAPPISFFSMLSPAQSYVLYVSLKRQTYFDNLCSFGMLCRRC
jgi:hypothetical protein